MALRYKHHRAGTGAFAPNPLVDTAPPLALNKASVPPPRTSKAFEELTSLSQSIANFKADLTCKICVRYLYEPFTAECGHTFCYSCLSQWFNGNSTGKKKTCPECRAHISHQPAPAYLVRDLVHRIIERTAFCDDGETVKDHQRWQQEEAQIVERDRSNTDPRTGGLFQGRFKPKSTSVAIQPHIIHDADDGVDRCSLCTWEIENGDDRCAGCGTYFGSGSDDSQSHDDDNMTIDSMIRAADYPGSSGDEDDELDDEMSLQDAEFDADLALEEMMSRPRSGGSGASNRLLNPLGQPPESINLVSESENSSANGEAEGSETNSDSDEDDEDEDDESRDDEDILMDGFIDNEEGSSSDSEDTEPRTSSPVARQGTRRGNPYIVESSSDESSEDEGGEVRRSANRQHRHNTTLSPSTTGDDSDDSV